MKRRKFLLGATASITGLAGCSVFPSDSPMLELAVFNHADTPYTVEMSIYRTGENLSRSEARVYDDSIDIAPNGEAIRDHVVEDRQYIVRYSAYEDDRRLTDDDHVHHYPTDDDSEVSLSFGIDPTGVLTPR